MFLPHASCEGSQKGTTPGEDRCCSAWAVCQFLLKGDTGNSSTKDSGLSPRPGAESRGAVQVCARVCVSRSRGSVGSDTPVGSAHALASTVIASGGCTEGRRKRDGREEGGRERERGADVTLSPRALHTLPVALYTTRNGASCVASPASLRDAPAGPYCPSLWLLECGLDPAGGFRGALRSRHVTLFQ